MGTWSLYDAATGVLTGVCISGPAKLLEQNTPSGQAAVEGAHDPMAVVVDLETKALTRRVAPPAGDELQEPEWSDTQGRWVWRPTVAARAQRARARRDRLLQAADKVTLRAYDRNEPVPKAWADYKEALRDLPQQPGFPDEVTWPEAPAI